MNKIKNKRPALLVIDLQEGIVDLPSQQASQSVIENSILLGKKFNEKAWPVFIVNVAGRPIGITENNQNSVQSSHWGDIISPLKDQPNYHYITKYSWGAFHNTELNQVLKALNISDVYITGIASSMGVDSTARQAFDLNYNVVIVKDAIADASSICHSHVCEHIFPKIALLQPTQQVIDSL